MKNLDSYIKIGRLAKRLRITPLTIHMLIKKGELPEPERKEGSWVFRGRDIAAWMERR